MLAAVLLPVGCGESNESRDPNSDTCSGGSNMENPHVTVATRAGSTTEATITWDRGTGPGAGLSEAYFEKVQVVGSSAGTASFSPERTMVVTLTRAPEPADGGGSVLRFLLLFPDRRTAIDCRHPGMADQYYLTVTLTFDGAGSLKESTAEESVSLGNI